jgi:phosphoadenosine phosphosulfate reductase
MKNHSHEHLMSLTLVEKIEYSKKIIKDSLSRFSTDELYIAWTGGKDSTTMLWLFLESCKESNAAMPKAMFIDEGSVFDEIFTLVNTVKEKWGIEVEIIKNHDVSDKAADIGDPIYIAELNERNRKEIEKLEYTEKMFPFEPESLVGNHLMKTVAMNMFIETNAVKAISTAIRWDEQSARIKEDFFSPRTDPDHTRIQPILHFSERNIWSAIHEYRIPFCSLYCQGYRSLGAKGSTSKISDIPAWEQDLDNTPERVGRGQEKEAIMEQLRDLGYM